MQRQRKHREVVIRVGGVDCGGVHFPHRGAWVTAEVAGGDGGHKRGIDVGDRHLSSGVILEQLARQPAEAGPKFEDLGRGDIGHLTKRRPGAQLVSTEKPSPSATVECLDDLALQIVDVVAV